MKKKLKQVEMYIFVVFAISFSIFIGAQLFNSVNLVVNNTFIVLWLISFTLEVVLYWIDYLYPFQN